MIIRVNKSGPPTYSTAATTFNVDQSIYIMEMQLIFYYFKKTKYKYEQRTRRVCRHL